MRKLERRKTGWKAKLLLLAASTIFVGVAIGVAEACCRYFTRINFLDNSSGLFTPGRYGNTYGNTPNFEGLSFGAQFVTDANGFRVDPDAAAPKPASDAGAILILGDSVSFGPALPENETVAAGLRRALPGRTIYNASAIGYDTFDYLNAGRAITSEKPEVDTVLLFFCLNDVNDASAQLIRSSTSSESQQNGVPGDLRSTPRIVNDYLRSRSKLYLLLKNLLVDTSMVHFRNDLANYQRGEENVGKALEPIVELNKLLNARGVKMHVFILPYEAQLRPDAETGFLQPQEMVKSFFRDNGVENTDVTEVFKRSGIDPDLLFLYGDPMHLSREGMSTLAQAVCSEIDECSRNAIAPPSSVNQ